MEYGTTLEQQMNHALKKSNSEKIQILYEYNIENMLIKMPSVYSTLYWKREKFSFR